MKSNLSPSGVAFLTAGVLLGTVKISVFSGTNLNDVTREMLTETYHMNMDMRLMQERLKQDPVYVKMFEDAGFGEPSNGAVRNAIPEYLKTLTSRGSAFDRQRV